tara:strand:+ start:179 stop:325 length:147 start_codon:yes stop_codon:yes gene_type:complete
MVDFLINEQCNETTLKGPNPPLQTYMLYEGDQMEQPDERLVPEQTLKE